VLAVHRKSCCCGKTEELPKGCKEYSERKHLPTRALVQPLRTKNYRNRLAREQWLQTSSKLILTNELVIPISFHLSEEGHCGSRFGSVPEGLLKYFRSIIAQDGNASAFVPTTVSHPDARVQFGDSTREQFHAANDQAPCLPETKSPWSGNL
jgi:hypothetical protein